jgi:hypothetical protein
MEEKGLGGGGNDGPAASGSLSLFLCFEHLAGPCHVPHLGYGAWKKACQEMSATMKTEFIIENDFQLQ